MNKEEILKEVLEIFNREKNWFHTTRNGHQLDIDNTIADVVDWVAKIIDTQAPVSGSLVTEADLVSFGAYLLSDERNRNVKSKKEVHHADLANWRDTVKNIGNQ